VLRKDGTKISDNSYPVVEAVKGYIKKLRFDGMYSNMEVTDAIQQVEGVRVVQVLECYARSGINPFVSVVSVYFPDSGYLSLLNDADLQIEYV